jgi:hypothetical protein
MTAMQIDYELTKRDFSEAFTAHRNRSPLRKWLRRVFVVVLVLLAVVILAGFLIKPSVQVGVGRCPLLRLREGRASVEVGGSWRHRLHGVR